MIFFVASSASSSAYLTVSEVFPLEICGIAISIFYAFGTLAGGVAGPAIYGYIVGTGSRSLLFWGYVIGARRHDLRWSHRGLAGRQRRGKVPRRRRAPSRLPRVALHAHGRHSFLSARIGSTLAARTAGTNIAVNAAAASTTDTPANVKTSVLPTP